MAFPSGGGHFTPVALPGNDLRLLLNRREDLHKDLVELWESKESSDIEIRCSDGVIKAHSQILSARSAVFRAIFDSGLSETKSGTVNIDDINLSTMQVLLKYMYTGEVESRGSIKVIADLICAADKYQLDSLKNGCFEYLVMKPELNWAADMVLLAHAHNPSDKVKLKLQQFIVKFRLKLGKIPEFMEAMRAKPLIFAGFMFENFDR